MVLASGSAGSRNLLGSLSFSMFGTLSSYWASLHTESIVGRSHSLLSSVPASLTGQLSPLGSCQTLWP